MDASTSPSPSSRKGDDLGNDDEKLSVAAMGESFFPAEVIRMKPHPIQAKDLYLDDKAARQLSSVGIWSPSNWRRTIPSPDRSGEGSRARDRKALMAVYAATNGQSWAHRTGWGTPADLMYWHGVVVNKQSRVVKLFLSRNALQGSVPKKLCDLFALHEIYLSFNRLNGVLPPELGRLRNLKVLSIMGCEVEGSIPRELGDLVAVRQICLSNNNLTGDIPPALGRLDELEELSLGSNKLSGVIPRDLGRLRRLKILALTNNELEGGIPSLLRLLVNLEEFSFCNNKLNGAVQTLFRKSPYLLREELALSPTRPSSGESLETQANDGILIRLLFEYITEDSADFNGVDPVLLISCTSAFNALLVYLCLNNCHFRTGHIPEELGDLVAVRQMHFANNSLSGAIPPQLARMSQLTALVLDNNELEGNIPSELWLLSKLESLSLSNNNLTGLLPPELGRLGRLKILALKCNKLEGNIPFTFGRLRNLEVLVLSSNKLSGPIPKELGCLVAVREMCLADNSFSGCIPSEIRFLPKLETLSLRSNRLSGPIPKELGNLGELRKIEFDDNSLSGNIPSEIGLLDKLQMLSLSSNKLHEISLELLKTIKRRELEGATFELGGNPLMRPPQTIVAMGIDQAISWWEDIQRFGEGTSNKLKMVLVGLAEAGKTTVVRNITNRPIPNHFDRTVGIEITEGWRPGAVCPLEVSIWDFAGQADYYASHQIFLTKGSLFLLVVDLRALFLETRGGDMKDGDPHGRVYRWLEMLNLRVPGAAVSIVGTHSDAAEFKSNPSNLEEAVSRLKQLITRYRQDKAKELSNIEEQRRYSFRARVESSPGQGQVPLDRQRLSIKLPTPPLIHDKVFKTSLERNSTNELEEWVTNAALLLDCPAGFHFPTVRAKIPNAWIDAVSTMDSLKASRPGKPCVTWHEAVEMFGYFMEAKGTPIHDAEDVLLRAMRHREAEGRVLLSLEDSPAPVGAPAGMLYLDPAWLMELVRRLTDHNLVDTTKEGILKEELAAYCDGHNPRLDLNSLWKQHRAYRTSGTLDLAYLRFLWLHRRLDMGATQLQLNLDEFQNMVLTMERLLVLYRVRGIDHTLYVVPARLPEYGDERVLEKSDMGVGDVVVRTRCSFRRSYPPPGIIGRFIAFSNAHIKEARECWQHGAHLIWSHAAHDVLVYEAHFDEQRVSDSVCYPGLVLCVKGNTPEARNILGSLTDEVERLLTDKIHGYPGLGSVVFEGTETVSVTTLSADLRRYLDNRFDHLDATIRRVAGVTSQVLHGLYLASKQDNEYPRLLILKPDIQPSSPTSRYGAVQQDSRREEATGMQRETWNGWIQACKENTAFRVVFLCEHDMTEVKCGPGGLGYLIRDLPKWLKDCMPLLQVSLWALRTAVGIVSNVDLPLNALLGAVARSTSPSTQLLGAMQRTCNSERTTATLLPSEPVGCEKVDEACKLQGASYTALCHFMRNVENQSKGWCGFRFACSNCRSARKAGCVCVSWRENMVQVENGRGGLVWVKKTNAEEYAEKIAQETERPPFG